MRTQALAQNYNRTLQWRNRLLIVALALLSLNIIQSVSIFSLIGTQKTIVIPATFDREFTVSSKFSDSYLEQMSQYFAALLLNITPNTFAMQAEQLLQHVASQNYAAVKTQLVAQTAEIEKTVGGTQRRPEDFNGQRAHGVQNQNLSISIYSGKWSFKN
jgi:type IV conjugative transfer system protein TraE